MSLRASVELLNTDDRRVADRRHVHRVSTVRAADAVPVDVEMLDLSHTGASFRASTAFPPNARIRLGLAGAGTVDATIVRRDGAVHGCEFDTSLSPAQSAMAFGVSSVVDFAAIDAQPLPPPVLQGWSRPVKLAVWLGGAVAAWTVVVLVVRALL